MIDLLKEALSNSVILTKIVKRLQLYHKYIIDLDFFYLLTFGM